MQSRARRTHVKRRQWILLLLTVAALYVVVPQLGLFHLSWNLLRSAEWPLVGLSLGFTGLTYMTAAASYCLLSFRRLRYVRTVLIQLAGMFANRLLPAGVGGIGTNYAYLRKMRHTPAQAASVVAANNLLGFAGHLLLLSLLLIIRGEGLMGVHRPASLGPSWWAVVAIAFLALLLIVGRHWRQRLVVGLRQTIHQLAVYRRRPLRLGAALLTSVGLTVCNIASFYGCLAALGINLSFLSVALSFTLGVGLGTVTPTPGGLGGVEAGLVAGLVAFRLDDSVALEAVLLYRLVSYWLPLVVGATAFVVAERRRYV